jgi:hypothetical protein
MAITRKNLLFSSVSCCFCCVLESLCFVMISKFRCEYFDVLRPANFCALYKN